MRNKEWPALLLGALSSFCVYTCMYAFRKPFTVAAFSGQSYAAVDYKIWLVVAQTIGYALSKFYGIKFIAELTSVRRPALILGFIGAGWIALLLFAVVPAPFNALALLLNGFSLGVIYGLVFSYLEGRRSTELLGAVLASSFIFASGFTQSVGKYILLDWNVSEQWMPFVTGAVFLLPTLVFTRLLALTPPPSKEDVATRKPRVAMTPRDRHRMVKSFLPGLTVLTVAYMLLTILRDYRSNFAANIWADIGLPAQAAVFTQTEIPASIITLVLLGMLVLVKNNFRAFMFNHLIIISGFGLCLVATWLYSRGSVSPFWWMTVTGVGLYMGYVPFNAMLFERLMASYQSVGNAGFLIYIADSFGYLGSVTVLLGKNFTGLTISWSDFFVQMLNLFSVLGILLTVWSVIYFRGRYVHRKQQHHYRSYA